MKFGRHSYFCPENKLGDLAALINGVLSVNYRSNALKRFDKKFSEAVKRKHSFSFGSGRMALFALLQAIDVRPGDEVIIQAFTCCVVPRAIISLGAVPIYVDIDKANFNMNLHAVSEKINSKTKAIIVQHTFGIKPNLVELKQLLNEHQLSLIEDCAHCMTPLNDSDLDGDNGLVFFSTDHTKLINTHIGGVVSCNNDVIAKKLKLIHSEAQHISLLNKLKIIISLMFEVTSHHKWLYTIMRPIFYMFRKSPVYFIWDDRHDCSKAKHKSGGVYKFSWIQAIIGLRQLNNIKQIINHRIDLSKIINNKYGYYNSVDDLPTLRYAFLVKDRDQFYKNNYKEIKHSTWFVDVVSGGEKYFDELKYQVGSCPIAETVSMKCVNLPLSSKITINYYK